ncbi:MAG: helix-turn-helix domain-containing protein [Actinobacteria bacterium]|nr:helix-turn-helix domain-containing protein [Actinomycetota bacterium]
MGIDVEEIFSVKEIADKLGTNPTAVRLLIKDGRLKALNISRGKERPVWKVTETQLKEYLDSLDIQYKEGGIDGI